MQIHALVEYYVQCVGLLAKFGNGRNVWSFTCYNEQNTRFDS